MCTGEYDERLGKKSNVTPSRKVNPYKYQDEVNFEIRVRSMFVGEDTVEVELRNKEGV